LFRPRCYFPLRFRPAEEAEAEAEEAEAEEAEEAEAEEAEAEEAEEAEAEEAEAEEDRHPFLRGRHSHLYIYHPARELNLADTINFQVLAYIRPIEIRRMD
jgi:hypothetical protein